MAQSRETEAPCEPVDPDFSDWSLGEHQQPIEIDTSREIHQVTLAMLLQARSSVAIISRHLDPPIYDQRDVAGALKELLLNRRHARVRIILRNPSAVARRGHRLVDLTQRLSSFIEIRTPSRKHLRFNSAMLIVDGIGTVMRNLADRYEATASFGDPRVAKEMTSKFNEIWELAEPDPNTRRMHL